ncbi:fimbrial protein [Serratia marcescens]|uniref:fimbrial protein n=1 Tax=Serratia marcescens TaxID=615 RepID=UPI00301D0642
MIKLTQAMLLATLCFNSLAWATGTLSIRGAVLESACAIEPDNAFQTIDLGSVPIKNIERNGASAAHPFTLRLVNCALTDSKGKQYKSIEVTFTGFDAPGNEMDKNGIRLRVIDENGRRIFPGVPVTDIPIHVGNMTLHYSVFWVGNGKRIRPGNYQTTMNILFQYL